MYIVAGNHEMKSDKSGNIIRGTFKIPENGNGLKLFHPFDWGENTHFVVIDTNEYNNSYKLGETQLEWLKKDLKNTGQKIVFVFGHEPAFSYKCHIGESLDKYPAERDVLWDIFKEHGIDAYFCGHEHLYNMSIREGICQIITGGAGAPLRVTPQEGGYYHFIIIDVKDSGKCEVTVKDIEGLVKDNFTIKNKP
ncbi:MAG: metallophosphoesterase [Candidatus Omnitrophica bacterium]|nr:metallophosphoesterase [Candidatus Omnitrophota bacterium]